MYSNVGPNNLFSDLRPTQSVRQRERTMNNGTMNNHFANCLATISCPLLLPASCFSDVVKL